MDNKTFTDKMQEALELITKANRIFDQGPLDYYLMKLIKHSEALLTKFAPIKLGQRAFITRDVDCKNGWAGREKTLSVGATGTINNVDYRDGLFVFDFLPDREYQSNGAGDFYQIKPRYTYCLSEKYLSLIPD